MNPLSPLALALVAIALTIALGLIWRKRRTTTLVGATMAASLTTLALATMLALGSAHGAFETNAPWTSDVASFATSLKRSPVAKNREPEDGQITILYRFGCKDCEVVYDSIRSRFGDEAIWISSRSDVGASLVEAHSIQSVPTGIYMRKDPKGNESNAIVANLVKTDAAGENPTFDEEAAQTLLRAQMTDRTTAPE